MESNGGTRGRLMSSVRKSEVTKQVKGHACPKDRVKDMNRHVLGCAQLPLPCLPATGSLEFSLYLVLSLSIQNIMIFHNVTLKLTRLRYTMTVSACLDIIGTQLSSRLGPLPSAHGGLFLLHWLPRLLSWTSSPS